MSYQRREIPNGTRIVMDEQEFLKAARAHIFRTMLQCNHYDYDDAEVLLERQDEGIVICANIRVDHPDGIVEVAKTWAGEFAGAPRIIFDEDGVAVEFGDEEIVITFSTEKIHAPQAARPESETYPEIQGPQKGEAAEGKAGQTQEG